MAKKTHSLPKKPRIKKPFIEKVDVPKIICVHLIGEDHTLHHRMGVGFIIMSIGVLISRFSEGSFYIIHFFGDLVGFAIHGIGTIPFGEALTQHVVKVRNSPLQGMGEAIGQQQSEGEQEEVENVLTK